MPIPQPFLLQLTYLVLSKFTPVLMTSRKPADVTPCSQSSHCISFGPDSRISVSHCQSLLPHTHFQIHTKTCSPSPALSFPLCIGFRAVREANKSPSAPRTHVTSCVFGWRPWTLAWGFPSQALSKHALTKCRNEKHRCFHLCDRAQVDVK